jgi:hypothetical protein
MRRFAIIAPLLSIVFDRTKRAYPPLQSPTCAQFSCQKSSYRMAIYIRATILDATRRRRARRLLWRNRMLKSKTSSQLVTDQQGAQAKRSSIADDIQPDHEPKKRGNLAATLDPLLQPRLAAGQPGRPKGASNYEWTPETDNLLVELCAKWGAAKAKRIIGRRIQDCRSTEAAPRPDSVRKAVEHRMAKLGIATGQKRRKPDMRKAKRWTETQTAAVAGRSRSGCDHRIHRDPHGPQREIRPCEDCAA